MERYRVEFSLNIWCENDEEAKAIAEKICDEQKKRFDNRCQVVSLQESPFGSFLERTVDTV
jgi:hypothetical protein|tara:strand:+ start:3645 stop:3827 length:183 start_codon:yes stop_codon:yes gene_type:complete